MEARTIIFYLSLILAVAVVISAAFPFPGQEPPMDSPTMVNWHEMAQYKSDETDANWNPDAHKLTRQGRQYWPYGGGYYPHYGGSSYSGAQAQAQAQSSSGSNGFYGK